MGNFEYVPQLLNLLSTIILTKGVSSYKSRASFLCSMTKIRVVLENAVWGMKYEQPLRRCPCSCNTVTIRTT